MRPQDDRDLRAVLREEVDRHEPDRDAMLRRINRNRPAAPGGVTPRGTAAFRRPLPAVRPVAAAAAVTGVLVLAVAGINLAARSPAPPAPVAAPSASPAAAPTSASPSPSPTGAAPSTGHPSPHHHVTSLGPPTATSASPPVAGDGYLTAVPALDPHSIDTWAQSNLTVTSTATITALDVTIKVARTDGVAKAGHWCSLPADVAEQAVHTSDTALLFRFTLKDGATLAPGTYTFAAQYAHAAGTRPLTGDSWTATGTARTGTAQTGTARLSGTYS